MENCKTKIRIFKIIAYMKIRTRLEYGISGVNIDVKLIHLRSLCKYLHSKTENGIINFSILVHGKNGTRSEYVTLM